MGLRPWPMTFKGSSYLLFFFFLLLIWDYKVQGGWSWLIAIPPNQIKLVVSLTGQAFVMATALGVFQNLYFSPSPAWNHGGAPGDKTHESVGSSQTRPPQESWNQKFCWLIFKFWDFPVIFLLLVSVVAVEHVLYDFSSFNFSKFVYGYGLFWWMSSARMY